jgi:hypothetical protein
MKQRGGWRAAAALAVGVAAIAAVGLAALWAPPPAAAHEIRNVGAYRFVVGWGTEPAYAGQENSVQLLLSRRATGRPVVDLGTTLHLDVVFGSRTMAGALEPTFDADTGLGTPGDYRAWLFPTAPGDYTFRFSGTIGSQTIAQSFTSGPTTFSPVQDPTAAEFPVQTPSLAELSQRLDTQLPRLAASSAASRAQLLGIIGLAVGALGLIVAVVALLRVRRA